MKIVIDATEPLDIRAAEEGEEGFEVADKWFETLQLAHQITGMWERFIVKEVINDYPDHPDVPYLREYLAGGRGDS